MNFLDRIFKKTVSTPPQDAADKASQSKSFEDLAEQATKSLPALEALLNGNNFQAAEQKAKSDIQCLSNSGFPEKLMFAHFGLLGKACYSLKKIPQALEAFTKAIELAPKTVSSELYADRAQIFGEANRYDEGLKDLSAALDNSEGRKPLFVADLYVRRALLFAMVGSIDSATADLDRALQLAPVGSPVATDANKIRAIVCTNE